MKICAVICEYNPFHNGHMHHIEQTKKEYGATHFIGIMSGNFTQRGDAAIFDKWKRAETALKNGIDLVIELPAANVLGSAETFATGAVTLINSLNCTDLLSFGSESGDIELLKETAGAVHYAMENDNFFNLMRIGHSFPVALQRTIEMFYDDDIIETLTTPNNTLGIEYLKALNETGSFVKPVTVKRYGAMHDGETGSGNILSASKIRGMLTENKDISAFIPDNCNYTDCMDYALISRLETAILAKLRSMSAAEISKAPNVLQGLENRIYKAARMARNLNELLFLIKTKRYTLARIRRIVLCCFLSITKSDARILPQYVHILGMNAKGKEILAKANCSLPIGTSLLDLMKSGETARRQGQLEERCGNMYALAFKKPLPCGADFTHKPIIIE